MDIGNIFIQLFLRPIINLLMVIYHGLDSAGVPGALGFSILLLTLLIRLLVWPIMTSQLRSAKKMADLRPHLSELKKKHKEDRQALAQAQMALYREHGVNPAGGCLPAVIQIPIFIALYQSITNVLPGLGGNLDYINSLMYVPWLQLPSPPDPHFLGLNLGIKPADFASSGILLLFIPLLTAGLTLIQSKMMLPKPVKEYPTDTPKEKEEKESMEDAMSSVQSQMVYLMPLMVGYFSFTFPIGLAIYWNSYTILGIVQQYMIAGWGGLNDWVVRLTGQDLANQQEHSIISQGSKPQVRIERIEPVVNQPKKKKKKK